MLFYDFYFFYAVGYLLHHGGNPYDLNQYISALATIGFPAEKMIVPFPYPPWTLWFFYILGSFSFAWSLRLHFILSVSGLFIAGFGSLYWLSNKPNWLSNAKKLFLIATFVPFLKCVLFGQITWIPFLAILGAIWGLRRNQLFLAGILLSLLMLKPHLWFSVYGFLLSYIYRHQFNLAIGMLVGMAFNFLFSFAVLHDPQSILAAYPIMSPHGASDIHIISASLTDILVHTLEIESIRYVLAAIAIGVGFWLGMRCNGMKVAAVLLIRVIPISLLLAPYAWAHDYILLLPFWIEVLGGVQSFRQERVFVIVWTVFALTLSWLLIVGLESFFGLLLIPLLFQWRSFFTVEMEAR